ncbi:hypothetical protein E6O75_ATG03837 [Venturia nashicola]|uniref:Uncharacterized protein n=1 Tax=Venturia nashicola TaxID=86259 RepID=A0A4Z1PT22_9PEZI|nr:hypothetical protein E6O75_ATG03837 [Venturia nashicola]
MLKFCPGRKSEVEVAVEMLKNSPKSGMHLRALKRTLASRQSEGPMKDAVLRGVVRYQEDSDDKASCPYHTSPIGRMSKHSKLQFESQLKQQ